MPSLIKFVNFKYLSNMYSIRITCIKLWQSEYFDSSKLKVEFSTQYKTISLIVDPRKTYLVMHFDMNFITMKVVQI